MGPPKPVPSRYGRVSRVVRRQYRRRTRVLGRGSPGRDVDPCPATHPRRRQSPVLPVVPGRGAEHVRERARSSPRAGPRRAGRADLRLTAGRHHAHVHLPRASRRDLSLRGGAARARRPEGRPRRHLHADGSRGRHRDAGGAASSCPANPPNTTECTARCCSARPWCSTKESRWAPPTRARSGGWSPNTV